MPSPTTSSTQPTLVFTHANGFVAGTYSLLFELWRRAGWRVIAPDKLGHDPAHPVTSGWPHLRDELLAYIRREAPGAPVVLAGHSMGGYVSLLAACRMPADQIRAVVLLDAPIVAGWRSQGFWLLKATGLIRRGGPGKVSARRREHWPDAAAVRAHFGGKRMFAAWDARCFEHYLEHGFERAPGGGMQLAFRRDVETRIYDTLPHHVEPLLRRHPLRCPVAYVEGTDSTEGRQLGLGYVRQLAGAHWRSVEGSHLYPMERPERTAHVVLELLDAMVKRSG
ncbi:MAG: alpha/beta hydrolase [Burkholderiaceae bacterium]